VNNERIPPHSEEAEVGVLGSFLLEPDKVGYLCDEKKVDETWFYAPSNRVVFEAICEIRQRHRIPDSLTVTNHLRSLGMLDQVGGFQAINRLIDSTPTAAHAEYYLAILRDSWQRRAAIAAARELECNGYAHDMPVLDSVGGTLRKLADIASSKTRVDTEDLIAEHRKIAERARNGEKVGWQTPWDPINSLLYGIHEPHHVVVAALTSSGKTALTINMVMQFVEQGALVAISENDMSRMDLEKRIVGMMCGINPLAFRTKSWTDEQDLIFHDTWRKLGRMPVFINEDRMTMDETESWAMSMKARHGIDIFVFDFLQKIKRTKEEWRHSLREVVGDWSCRTCEIGKRMKACTVALSQFSRSGNKEKDTTPPHPTLENLKETGEIENNADVVMLISKKPGQPVDLFTGKHPVWDIDVDIAKNRNGPTGITEMSLLIRTQKFVTRTQGDIERDEIGREEEVIKKRQNNGLTNTEDND